MGARVESARVSSSSNMNMMMSSEEFEGNTKITRIFETFLRLVPIGLSVAALVIMLKNSQENDYGSVSYSDLASFRYLVQANGICAGYSLISAGIVALSHPPTMPKAWAFFLLDQVQTYLILTAGAASMEVLYLAKKGNTSTTWSSACGSFGSFFHKATISLAFTFLALVCYVMISLISSYKLFSKYDAPPISTPTNNNDKGGIYMVESKNKPLSGLRFHFLFSLFLKFCEENTENR